VATPWRCSAEQFYAAHPRQTLTPDELLIRIVLPGFDGWSGAFIKLARTAFDFSIVDVAALLRLEEGKIADLRLAVAGTSTLPWRAKEAERLLRGKRAQAGAIEEAAAGAAAQARVVADVRTSEDYRRRMLREILARAIARAVERAGARVRP
jgi:carbon-monoxide dehydrogenase medium subunit